MSATKPLAAAPPDISTHLDVRTEVRRIHAGVLFFYIVDAVLLGLLGAVGTVSQDLGLWYALAGCAATDLAFYWFRSQGGRADDLEALALGLTGSTGLVMLATLALAPQVGMLMLMSMMAVLALSAVWLTWQMAKASAHNITGTRLRQQVNRTNAELAQALGTLERVASTDELTMLPNRRAILAGVQRAVAAEQHGKGPVGIALLDIDRLKLINDSRGHEVGDHVLRDFGRVLALGLRPSDQVGRYGGEEFLLLLQEIDDAAAAADVVERLCANVEAYDWSRIAPGLAVTASVGVTLLMPGEDGAAAIRRADAVLYQAKQQGRNQVVTTAAQARQAKPVTESVEGK